MPVGGWPGRWPLGLVAAAQATEDGAADDIPREDARARRRGRRRRHPAPPGFGRGRRRRPGDLPRRRRRPARSGPSRGSSWARSSSARLSSAAYFPATATVSLLENVSYYLDGPARDPAAAGQRRFGPAPSREHRGGDLDPTTRRPASSASASNSPSKEPIPMKRPCSSRTRPSPENCGT